MTIDTHIDSARDRVCKEREAVQQKQTAVEQFISRVQNLSPVTSAAATSSHAAALSIGGTQLSGASRQAESGCSRVRTAFADTVRSHSVADIDEGEPLLETIRSELSESIAVAVAPTTETTLTSDLQAAIVGKAQNRQGEIRALATALEREHDQSETATEIVGTVTDWIVDVNDTPLTGLGFDALRERHTALTEHCEECTQLAVERQEFLHGTTSRDAQVGISHRSLLEYLYQDFPVHHPVLATIARLAETCEACQRVVRQHLVRRA
jgi:hypothetical protein